LAKQHRDELLPAGETATLPLCRVLPNQRLKLQAREELQTPDEDAAYSIHGGGLVVGGTQFLAEI
jgi:hypothetical protein